MWEDPIVEEVRRYGNAYVARFHNDVTALFCDLQQKQRQTTHQVVSLKPKPFVVTPALKAGHRSTVSPPPRMM